jgi:hypothetical protein
MQSEEKETLPGGLNSKIAVETEQDVMEMVNMQKAGGTQSA